MKTINISTHSRVEMLEITDDVKRAVRESEITDGAVIIFIPHTTAGVTINENADPDVTADMTSKLSRMIPKKDKYHHFEGNSDAHLKTTLTGSSEIIPIKDNKMTLGRWQGIYFCEFDGPRKRNVIISIITA